MLEITDRHVRPSITGSGRPYDPYYYWRCPECGGMGYEIQCSIGLGCPRCDACGHVFWYDEKDGEWKRVAA